MSSQIGLVVDYVGSKSYGDTEFKRIEMLKAEIPTYVTLNGTSLKWFLPNQHLYLNIRFIDQVEVVNLLFGIKTHTKINLFDIKESLYRVYSKKQKLEGNRNYLFKVTHLVGLYFWGEFFDITDPNTAPILAPYHKISDETDLVKRIFISSLHHLHLLLKQGILKNEERILSATIIVYRLCSILKKRNLRSIT